jgi:hypothetical protein
MRAHSSNAHRLGQGKSREPHTLWSGLAELKLSLHHADTLTVKIACEDSSRLR